MNSSTHGAYVPQLERPLSTLRLALPRADLLSCWSRCGWTADYIATYLSAGFEVPERAMLNLSTILNELIENALKFSLDGDHDLDVAVPVWEDRLTVEARHVCATDQAERFAAWIERLHDEDIETMWVGQVEHTAADEPDVSSLGLLNLTKHFAASLGLRVLPYDTGVVQVALQVHVSTEVISS